MGLVDEVMTVLMLQLLTKGKTYKHTHVVCDGSVSLVSNSIKLGSSSSRVTVPRQVLMCFHKSLALFSCPTVCRVVKQLPPSLID